MYTAGQSTVVAPPAGQTIPNNYRKNEIDNFGEKINQTAPSNPNSNETLTPKFNHPQSPNSPNRIKFSTKMSQNPTPKTLISTLGREITQIILPVTICMTLVVLLVTTLNTSSNTTTITSIATIAYSETTSDTIWDKIKGALLNSLVFVGVVTVATFVLVFLFYMGCTKFLKLYMGFSAFVVLGFMGGEVGLLLIERFGVGVDCMTVGIVMVNFAVIGVLAVFVNRFAIVVTQGYLVVIGMLVAYWFTMLPEWTTWVLLVAMSLYDLAAVLLPGGPLRILVELAMSRDEDIPALVYEARPVNVDESRVRDGVARRRWRERSRNGDQGHPSNGTDPDETPSQTSGTVSTHSGLAVVEGDQREEDEADVEEGQVLSEDVQLAMPLIGQRADMEQNVQTAPPSDEDMALEGIGLGSSGSIKLGLGDFIFYSVLVGRAAMYDFMTVYACYLAIIAGLGITLMLLALYQKALPALPVSILLGVLFYALTRTLLEVFIMECSLNLLMF